MKIGPKYKLARRLGAPIFEKTQTQKFTLSEQKKEKNRRRGRRRGPLSQYGRQLLEKQKARFTYGITEKQFSNYVRDALNEAGKKPTESLFERLERRLDNVVFRAGFAPTRRAARQFSSHGHFLVNGRKSTIPSQRLRVGDVISIREGSKSKGLFDVLADRIKEAPAVEWLAIDLKKKEIKVQGLPVLKTEELLFDLDEIIEFYNR